MSIVAVAASAEGQLRYPCRLDHSNTRQPSRGRLRGAEGSMRNDTFDEPPVWVNTPNQYEGMQHPAVPDLESVQRAANKRGQ